MSHETALPAELLILLGVLPGAPPEGVLRAFLERQREAHPDNGGTVGDWLNLCWAYAAARAGDAYNADPHRWMQNNPRPRALGDWRAVALEEICRHLPVLLAALEQRREYQQAGWEEIIRLRMAEVEVWDEFLPEVWDLATVRWTTGRPPTLLAVQADIAALVRLPELSHLAEALFQVVWHTKPRKRASKVALGSIKALSSTDRGVWATLPAPHFKLQLWWAWWAAMGTWIGPRGYPEHRSRLLHHELCHAQMHERKGELVGRIRGHDIEEFGATLERFGALDVDTGRLLRTGAAHPRTSQLTEEVVGDPSWLVAQDRKTTTAAPHTMEDWNLQIVELRDALEIAIEEVVDTDTGYLPADEIAAQIAVLGRIQSPSPTHMASLAHVREQLRRYRPVRPT